MIVKVQFIIFYHYSTLLAKDTGIIGNLQSKQMRTNSLWLLSLAAGECSHLLCPLHSALLAHSPCSVEGDGGITHTVSSARMSPECPAE